MTVNTTRILKEVRPLFWPWCAVALAGAVPLVYPLDWAPLIYLVGFLAVPLLATLAFGNEFQHGTLSLLLSQPVGRMRLWSEKLSVTVVAVLSAVLLFSLALRTASFRADARELALAGAWIVAAIAASTYWTLLTRSRVGGVALTIGVQSLLFIALNLGYWVLLCYAGVMLWLGRRTFTRYQATGELAGDDLLTAGPRVLPVTLTGWLRCRPTGAVLNLFRRELRLLRPVWLISLLAGAGWACLTLFALLHGHGSTKGFELAVVSVGVISTLMIAILAGSLPLGEERTSGTHAWNLTLPVPALLQWRIKLYTALFAGFVGAGLLPVLIGGRLFGPSHLFNLGPDWLIGVVLLTFAAFWCACAVKGTVRAALWVLPVTVTFTLASEFGMPAGGTLVDLVVSRFHPFANFKFADAVASSMMFPPVWPLAYVVTSPFRGPFLGRLLYIGWYSPWPEWEYTLMLAIMWVPLLLLAVIQSYRLFRSQIQDSVRPLLRNLTALAIATFLPSFFLTAYSVFGYRAAQHNWTLFDETVRAIAKIQSGDAKQETGYPLRLSEEDLAKASPLSESTRRWLRGSHVTIIPMKYLPHRSGNIPYDDYGLNDSHPWYLASIYLAGGSDCTESFPVWWRRDVVHLRAVFCK